MSKKQVTTAFDLDICSFDTAFTVEQLNEEEKSLFIQYSYVYVNNLIYLHMYLFKKVSLKLKNHSKVPGI